MNKTVGFGLLVAFVVAVFVAGPLRQLRSGVVEFRKTSYPQGRRLLRRDEPVKFYLHVGLEILFMIFALCMGYWVIIRSNAPPH